MIIKIYKYKKNILPKWQIYTNTYYLKKTIKPYIGGQHVWI